MKVLAILTVFEAILGVLLVIVVADAWQASVLAGAVASLVAITLIGAVGMFLMDEWLHSDRWRD